MDLLRWLCIAIYGIVGPIKSQFEMDAVRWCTSLETLREDNKKTKKKNN